MNIFQKAYYKHFAKKLQTETYCLYKVIIHYNDGTTEDFSYDKYTFVGKEWFIRHYLLHGNELFFIKDDTYILLANIRDITIEILDEQKVYYLYQEELKDMTLQEIKDFNNDKDIQILLKLRSEMNE
jgi:hypothetical protein